MGYKLIGKKLLAVKFGIPQKRKRVIMIGLLKGNPIDCLPVEIINNEESYVTVKEAIDDLPKIRANGGEQNMSFETKPNSKYQEFVGSEMSVEEYIKTLYQR